ncbi:MAG: MotA/TolQ/ExbB proton channel family protein [Megasphaera sp.]|jgi:biopolymer transport protein ExbB|nr:MotA/TolQ/ExbB proton channel family protein [Megasphaera sp.]MCH4187763.1 MotA/TolQ/ExbB proton channel family protein [Megasphaera sp.]MCH4217816.1 MotA/TolQ/ExbB proton channel family protein [Megasphaera sp.]
MDVVVQGIHLFQQGGVVMYILLACSLFVVYIGVERFLFYRTMDSGRRFANDFYTYMKMKKYADAAALARQGQGGLARILTDAAGGEYGASMKAFMETQSGILIAKFRSRLYYLSVIVTMAPLLGLLGTISGMIKSFSIFNIESGQAVAITGGVGEALIATAFGLCVAVLSLAVHAYFTQRLDTIITDMEMCFSALEMKPQHQ